jgi:CubicO group peptidase (beta-lactamase class C family)
MTPEGSIGYGYLWNVISEDVGLGRAYLHGGAGVHLLAVFPDLKIVVVHRVDTLADSVQFTGDDLNGLLDLFAAALIDLK